MAGGDIASDVIAELDSIIWDGLDPNNYRDPATEAVANGIQGHIDANWSISATTVGVVTPPTPLVPFPFTESVTVDLTVAASLALKALFLSMIAGTDPQATMIAFFGALQAWLVPWPVSIISGTALNPIAGAGVATFPMAAMATPCYGQMSASTPSDRGVAWDIMGTHIYNGLSGNIIAPIPTTGTYILPPTGVYAGVTTCVLTF